MRKALLMPKLGLTMTEGTLVEWALAVGARFQADETLFVVETDKAANDVGAEASGTLLEIVHGPGEVIAVGEVVGYWEDDTVHGVEAAPVQAAERPDRGTEVTSRNGQATHAAAASHVQGFRSRQARVIATPMARRLAQQHGVDLSALQGSGPGGRVTAGDVEAARAPAAKEMPGRPSLGGTAAVPVRPTATQLTMARRLGSVKQGVPHFYLALEADVGPLLGLREKLKETAKEQITLNDCFLAALGRALRERPEADRVWIDDMFVPLGNSDVGVAVHSPHGLLVPVLRGVGYLDLMAVAGQARSLVARARQGRLTSSQMTGGAITLSNAGMFDVTYMTPIINPGQAMVLGVGSIREVFRPDAAGQPVLRREAGLATKRGPPALPGRQ